MCGGSTAAELCSAFRAKALYSFWWEKNINTHPQCIAFYDTPEEALEGGHSWGTREGEWNWAVYAADGTLVDGCY